MILDAAIGLLLEGGANEVTATRIADETGVARTTIYRQWPDQAGLLLATIESLVTPGYDAPDTGDVEADLRTTLSDMRVRTSTQQVRPIFAALVDLASRDEAFVPAQQSFIAGLVEPTCDVLEAAQQRGVLSADLDCSAAAVTLAGPLLYQFLVARDTIGDDLIDRVMSQFVTSLTAR